MSDIIGIIGIGLSILNLKAKEQIPTYYKCTMWVPYKTFWSLIRVRPYHKAQFKKKMLVNHIAGFKVDMGVKKIKINLNSTHTFSMRIKQRLEINMAWMKPVQSLHMLTQLFSTPLDVELLMDHLCLAFLIIWFSKEIGSCFKVEHVLRDFRKFCCKEDKSRLNYQKTDSLNREFTFLGKVCWLHL